MAQLKYDKAKRMLWVKDGNDSFPIFTLANLNGNNTRLTSEGFLQVKNSNTESWETVKDSSGYPISLMGAPGKDGENGKPVYTWVKYADDQYGGGISDSPITAAGEFKKYIGFSYNNPSPIESGNPDDYKWSLIKGEDGESGQVLYTWIKYADDANGAGISDDPVSNGKTKSYIGFAYNKNTPTESDIASDYTWSQIKGDDGVPGEKGADGTIYYTWIKYADVEPTSTDDDIYDTPTMDTQYIGIATNQTKQAEELDYRAYNWSKFKGDQGVAGKDGERGIPGEPGPEGKTYYTWIKYADILPTSSNDELYESPRPTTEYIGISTNQEDEYESSDYSVYKWSKFKGDQGVKGEDGIGFKIEFPANPNLGDTFTWGGDSGINNNCFLGYVMTGQQYVYSQLPSKLGLEIANSRTCLIPLHVMMYIPDLLQTGMMSIRFDRAEQIHPLTFDADGKLIESVTTATHNAGIETKYMSWAVSYGLTDSQIKDLQPYIVNIAKSVFDSKVSEYTANYASAYRLPKYLQGSAMKCKYSDFLKENTILNKLFTFLQENPSNIFTGLQQAIAGKLAENNTYDPDVYIIPIQAVPDTNLGKSWISEMPELTEGWAPCDSVLHNGFNTNLVGTIYATPEIGGGEVEM